MADPVLNEFKNSLTGAFLNDVYLRDYTHAAKTFIPNKFSNAPKVKFLFHTYFNINAQAWTPPSGIGTNNYGVLVKSVKLPSFSFDTDIMNQYNRKRIIQSKIKYEPVDVTFHDDNASQVTAMWNAYYRYYYADSWNPELTKDTEKRYNRRNIYDASLSEDMQYGYRGDTFTGKKEREAFFDDITVYGLWNQQYIAYTFINPIIKNWSGDTYDYAQAEGTMQHSMTIDYETVTYNTGYFSLGDETEDANGNKISSDAVGKPPIPGFGTDAYYDHTDSPNESVGFNNNVGDFANMFSFGKSGNSDGENIRAGLNAARNFDKDKIIANAKNAVKDGLKDAVLSSLTGGLFGNGSGSSTPTKGASSAMVGISNQGGVTGANNENITGGGATAGKQNFGDTLVSNVARNLGFGG